MPDPCAYDDEDEFHRDCVSERQRENPDETIEQSNAVCYSIWRDRDCDGKAVMSKTVFKVGHQSPDDPHEFIMSTASKDRHGDVVEQDWDLRAFRKNPIALWNHDSHTPIGNWQNVRVEGDKLVGRLKLAAQGTSELIDTIRSLVAQRVLKAVSVGFLPANYEALDDDDPCGGMRLSGNELMECSLCSVPANSEALQLQSFKAMDAMMRAKLIHEVVDRGTVSAAMQLSDPPARGSAVKPQGKKMPLQKISLSDKIEAKGKQLDDLRNQLVELNEDYDAEGDMPDEVFEQVAELTQRISKTEQDLGSMKAAEKALALKSEDSGSAREQAGTSVSPLQKRITVSKSRAKGHFAFAAIASILKAHKDRTSPLAVAEAAYKNDPEVGLIIKAATDPATMTDAAWAGPLVRETWGEFQELLRETAFYPALPGTRIEFDRYGKINLPRNVGRGQLSGGWVGELSPIPVKEGAYDTVDLEPKKLGVATSFSKEIAMHSMPAIQGLVQNQILADTAQALDTYYLDATARGSLRPAGMRDATETGAANINAATGATVANILVDLKGMVSRFINAYAGSGAVWLINPLNILSLSVLQDAASGEFVFKEELMAGTLMGYPFISNQDVAVDILVLHGNGAVVHGNNYSPMIDVSTETALVYDDTAPEDIVSGGLATTQPVRSLFQTDAMAVKITQGLDWRIVRVGGIQVLTGWAL